MLTTLYYPVRYATPTSRQLSTVYYAISLADFKEWLKWGTDTSEDSTMDTCLYAAVKQAESFTRRQLFRSVWQSYLPGFYRVQLDILPIDVSSLVVKYYDSDNVLQTLNATEYYVQDNGVDNYVDIRFDGTLPSLYDLYEPVYIEFTAGYSVLPEPLKMAILKLAADYFENRTNEVSGAMNQITFGSQQAMYPYKML